MSKGERRDVVQSKIGSGWDVTKPGKAEPISHHRTQANADRAVAADLQRHGGGERVTHGRDGRVRSKDTIPSGRDPNPPRDREH
jgi:hypothetical protein